MTADELNELDCALSKIAGLSDTAENRRNLRVFRELRIHCAAHHAVLAVAATAAGWTEEALDERLTAQERSLVANPQRLALWPGHGNADW
jgi:hypothetical protein